MAANHFADALAVAVDLDTGIDRCIGMEQRQSTLGLAQEMGAGHDFLAGIAAFLDAEGWQALKRKLLGRPLSALFRRQSRQAMLQVVCLPARAGIGLQFYRG